jgi:uncharacterized Zn finger protein
VSCDRCGESLLRLVTKITTPRMCYCPRCGLVVGFTPDEFAHLWIDEGGEG